MMRDHYCPKSKPDSQSQTSMTTARLTAAADHSKQDEHGERESERLVREIRIEEQEVWVSHIQQRSNPGHPRRTGKVFVEEVERQNKHQTPHANHHNSCSEKRESCQTAKCTCGNLQSRIKGTNWYDRVSLKEMPTCSNIMCRSPVCKLVMVGKIKWVL